MENEIKINVPEGYEIDKENSTFECIKFKPIAKRWRDEVRHISGYYISSASKISSLSNMSVPENYNVFATEKQAKSALAMARISQIMANDERFGGVITDKEWNNCTTIKYIIMRMKDDINTGCTNSYWFLAFHTSKQRDLFLEENKDLVKDYLMIE